MGFKFGKELWFLVDSVSLAKGLWPKFGDEGRHPGPSGTSSTRPGAKPSTIHLETRHRWNPAVTRKALLVLIAERISQGRLTEGFTRKGAASSSKEKRNDFKEPPPTCWVVMFHRWFYWPSPWGCWVSFSIWGGHLELWCCYPEWGAPFSHALAVLTANHGLQDRAVADTELQIIILRV